MIEHVFPPAMMQEREKQLITALLDCAGVYYDVNFTKDQILGEPIQIVDGVPYAILQQIGKEKNCAYTEIVEYWSQKMTPDAAESYRDFASIDKVRARYASGERKLAHKFWTQDVLGNPMLAEQKILLYEDITNGDLLGLSYVSNGNERDSLQQKQRALNEQYEEAAHRVATFQNASVNLPGGYHRCSTEEGYPFLFISSSFEKIVGYTTKQLQEELDNKFVNLVLPEDLPRFAELESSLKRKGHGEVAYRIRRRDGSVRWVQDSTLFIDWEGTLCLQRTLADITDVIAQQEAVSLKNADLNELAENVPCGYHRCTTDNGFLLEFVSDNFAETVGYTREELLGMPFLDLVAEEDRELFMRHEPELADKGKIDLVYRIRRKDGSYRWIKDSTVRVKLHGKDSYQCILADITEFVERQETIMRKHIELLQKETMLETMEQSMPGGYHRCRAEEGCPLTYVGDHFTDIVGFTKEEIEKDFGNLYRNLLWEEDVDQISTYEEMLAMRGKGNAYDISVYRLKHKDGGYRWVTDSTMFVDLGEESFFQAIISDITPYIEGLNAAKREAEASSLAKSTFLFNASHDIRTPMNAIKGFAHIIAENPDDVRLVEETVKKIQQASDTLMTLMNDILDLSRIERGKETVNPTPVRLDEHGENLYQMFAESMAEADIEFRLVNKLIHPLALCDNLKLTRIGMNMISNAKKFTPAGGSVTFGIEELSSTEHTGTYRFYTKDTGIGMSEEFQQRAFEQFERERTSTESGVSGSGLGLSIIKKLVELMGGSVDIHSTLGVGTEITTTFTLPLVKEETDEGNATMQTADVAGKRVLLVEDNEFNREIARYVLEGMDLLVDEAENGLVCVDKLLCAGPDRYDLILMDLQMPVMDGYEATKEIRAFEDARLAGIPIIAMTANAFEEDKRQCLAAGMNGHVGKPIDVAVLTQEIIKVL